MAEVAQVDPFVFRLSIFVLAIFVGYYVVWSVTPAPNKYVCVWSMPLTGQS